VASELAPSGDFMRDSSALARRGALGLVAAYLWRPFLLAWKLPRGAAGVVSGSCAVARCGAPAGPAMTTSETSCFGSIRLKATTVAPRAPAPPRRSGQCHLPRGWTLDRLAGAGLRRRQRHHREVLRELALPLGLVDNKVCAIDDT
jgi:hypothetical protein